tara:strand:- start:803 stop:1027 length:225 start_codon:yes stop_codon:yes gene_type:complete
MENNIMSNKDYAKNFGDIDIARVRFDKEEYNPGDTVNADIEIDLSKLHSRTRKIEVVIECVEVTSVYYESNNNN